MIRKNEGKGRFVRVSNQAVNDSSLSLEARGLLLYLLARPADWQVSVMQLRREFGMGRDRAYRIVNELLDAGYMKRARRRDGTMDYWVADEPVFPKREQAPEPAPNPGGATIIDLNRHR